MDMTPNMEITRAESSAIKGILIILIILGHFQPYVRIPVFIRSFIYAFHVNCFLILPLFYPIKQLNFNRIKNYFARLMIPYTIIYGLLFIGSCVRIIAHDQHDTNVVSYIMKGGWTYLVGGYYPLYHTIDLRYLWFLPLMFSFSIVKDYYNSANNRTKYYLLCFGFVFY